MKQLLPGPDIGIFDRPELTRADMLALDRLAAAAWPASEASGLDGWQLRFADGVSRRANSVAPFPASVDARPLDTRIDAVEAFYRTRALPPRFQISPAADPADLDAVLSARGYVTEAPVTIQIAPAARIAATARPDAPITVATTATADWYQAYSEGYDRDARAITEAAREQPAFAMWRDPGEQPASIGLGVLGGNWLGIFGMWTRPAHRNHGIGGALLAALAAWGVARGAIGLYLQVEDHNTDARRLYERIGFKAVYGYHYRTHWTPS